MSKYVALLRGINVTGKNMIRMETLRATFESLGFENVKSYINSGNLVFETRKTDDGTLAKTIHDAIRREFGFEISVMVRSMTEIKEIARWNPFAGQFESHKDVHVFFLNDKLSGEQEALLLAGKRKRNICDLGSTRGVPAQDPHYRQRSRQRLYRQKTEGRRDRPKLANS